MAVLFVRVLLVALVPLAAGTDHFAGDSQSWRWPWEAAAHSASIESGSKLKELRADDAHHAARKAKARKAKAHRIGAGAGESNPDGAVFDVTLNSELQESGRVFETSSSSDNGPTQAQAMDDDRRVLRQALRRKMEELARTSTTVREKHMEGAARPAEQAAGDRGH